MTGALRNHIREFVFGFFPLFCSCRILIVDVLKAFPEILLSPKTWQKCVLEHRGLPIDHARSSAYESSLTWRGDTPNDTEFGVFRSSSKEAYWEPELIESYSEKWRTGGVCFEVDIVKIKDGSVVVVPPIRQEDLEWREYHM
jgi:hypothetical protein